ncbi:MAG: ATP synthase subunit I [Panacagrimonas sp.]
MSLPSIWGASLVKAMALQWGAVAALAGGACFWSVNAGLSLLGGGLAVVLPNTLLALWLRPRLQRADAAGAVALMVAEGLKLMGTTGLLLAVVLLMRPGLVWPGFLAGIVVALVAQWATLWVTRRY